MKVNDISNLGLKETEMEGAVLGRKELYEVFHKMGLQRQSFKATGHCDL